MNQFNDVGYTGRGGRLEMGDNEFRLYSCFDVPSQCLLTTGYAFVFRVFNT